MQFSHTGHHSPPPPPNRLLIFLTQGNWTPSKFSLLHNLVDLSLPREDYHLSLTTLEGYHPLERIITSHSLPWGIVTPSSLSNHYPGELPTPTQSDLSSRFRVPHPLPLFPTIILVQLFAFIVRVMG